MPEAMNIQSGMLFCRLGLQSAVVWSEQFIQSFTGRVRRVHPTFLRFGVEDHRHTIVDRTHELVRRRRHNRVAVDRLAVLALERLPQSGKTKHLQVHRADAQTRFALHTRSRLPFKERIGGRQTAPGLKRAFPRCADGQLFALGVLDWFVGPVRGKAPMQGGGFGLTIAHPDHGPGVTGIHLRSVFESTGGPGHFAEAARIQLGRISDANDRLPSGMPDGDFKFAGGPQAFEFIIGAHEILIEARV